MEQHILPISLKQLHYVDAVGRLGSIANAAEEMNISQSSITAAISTLEYSLGFDVFLRMPAKGLYPTPSGFQILQLITRFLVQAVQLETEFSSMGGPLSGLVRIGIYSTTAPAFLPIVLKAIAKEIPGISIRVLEGDMSELIDVINSGKADLLFTYKHSIDEQHEFIELFRAPPYALVPMDDRLVEQDEVTVDQLHKKPMVLLDLPYAREYYSDVFRDLGYKPNIVHSTRSAEIVRALVSGGYGFSILNILHPDFSLEKAKIKAIPIRDKALVPVFGIAKIAKTRSPTVVNAFVETCTQLKELGSFDSLVCPAKIRE